MQGIPFYLERCRKREYFRVGILLKYVTYCDCIPKLEHKVCQALFRIQEDLREGCLDGIDYEERDGGCYFSLAGIFKVGKRIGYRRDTLEIVREAMGGVTKCTILTRS